MCDGDAGGVRPWLASAGAAQSGYALIMGTHSVSLPEHLSEFIQKRVRSGRYQNGSEVVRAALRLREQKEAEDAAKLASLRGIAEESFAGLERGEFETVTPETLDGFFADMDRRVRGT